MTNVAILAAGAVAATVVGGLGWKSLKNRKAAKPVGNKPAKLTAEEQALRKLEIRARMMGHYEMPAKAPMAVAVAKVVEPVIDEPMAAVEPQDVVKFDTELNLVSVSRMRAVETPEVSVEEVPEVIEPVMQTVEISEDNEPVNRNEAPMFWDHFLRNIRRPDVIALKDEDFVNRPTDLPRGYHRATLCGNIHGILHVTKGNISFVYHVETTAFAGISSAANRFGGKGIQELTAKQAKDFLNGR